MTDFRDLKPVVAGDDLSFILRFKDSHGDPINVAGDTVILTFQRDMTINEEVLAISYFIPEDTNSENGIIHFPVSNEDSDVPPATYNYDFVWIKSNSDLGKRETMFLGRIKVVQGVEG